MTAPALALILAAACAGCVDVQHSVTVNAPNATVHLTLCPPKTLTPDP